MSVIAMAFRDDRIETIGRDSRIRILDRHFRELVAPSQSASVDTWAATFSADGLVVALADRSGVVRIGPVSGTTETAIDTGTIVGGLASVQTDWLAFWPMKESASTATGH